MSDPRQSLQVLAVDDSAIYRRLVEHALASEAYTLLLAKSGREALDLYAKHSPSIVITDWMMPDFSGLELCERIRGDRQRGYTYIILLTSMTEKGSIVKGLAAGADDYLTKPFDPGELLARIGVGRRIIALHQQIEAKNRELEETARTDPLTGLPNRRAIEEWATKQIKGAARHGFPVWVVIADLDFFKKINDTYGHEAGDTVLRTFGQVMKDNSRSSDVCGRLGGEEFAYILTHVTREDIAATIERLRGYFEEQEFTFGGEKVKVTASFGVAGFEGQEELDFASLAREADKALYAAKRAGRNQVCIA